MDDQLNEKVVGQGEKTGDDGNGSSGGSGSSTALPKVNLRRRPRNLMDGANLLSSNSSNSATNDNSNSGGVGEFLNHLKHL